MSKISVRFSLRTDKKSSKDNLAPVMGTFTFNSNRGRFHTDIRIPLNAWDKKREEVKSSFSDAFWLNQQLSELKFSIKEIFDNRISSGKTVTPDYIKKKLSENNNHKGEGKEIYLNDYFLKWIEFNKKIQEPGTINTYDSTFKQLKSYQTLYQEALTLEDIDHDFKENFIGYLTNEFVKRDGTIGLSNSTVGKTFKILTTFMNNCVDKEYTKNLKYLKFKVPKTIDAKRFTLTEEEVEKIEKLDLTSKPHLKISRDVFLLGCYTGLRYSDIVTLKNAHIRQAKDKHGDVFHVIEKVMDKSDHEVKIPLKPEAHEIIERYRNSKNDQMIFNAKAHCNINKDLKVIGEMAGLNTHVVKKIKRGGRTQELVSDKAKLLSMHISRYTFANIQANKGLNLNDLRKILGHKKIETTVGYLNVNQDHEHESFLAIIKK